MQGLTLRAATNGKKIPSIVGYAAVYNRWSEPLPSFGGMFREKIARGAFRELLSAKPDVRAFRGHDPDKILGRTPETLRLSEDEKGLRIELSPPDTELGRETVELIRRGDLDGMSFGFRVDPDGAQWNDDGTERVVTDVAELLEVSIVSFPAYKDTVASVTRSRATELQKGRIEHRLEAMTRKMKKREDSR